MYTIVKEYKVQAGLTTDAARHVAEGLVPRIRLLAGFSAYYVVDLGEDELATVSIFKTREGAEESVLLAREWIEQTARLGQLLPLTPTLLAGEVYIHASEFD